MGFIDLILNVACLLLWFNWRSAQVAGFAKSSPVSLAATVKKAEPRRSGGWFSLFALLCILGVRSLFYWKVGAAWNWTPRLELGVVTLPFRSDFLERSALFSASSFALVLGGVYAWLLLISAVNNSARPELPLQKLLRAHLGRIERWRPWAKLLLVPLAAALTWGLANPFLAQLGLVPAPLTPTHAWQQAVLLGLSSVLIWKFLLLAVCVLYLINSYVYLGNSPFWSFVNTTGANLLAPLRRLPLRIDKLDLSPLLAIALILGLAHWAARWLPKAFEQLPL